MYFLSSKRNLQPVCTLLRMRRQNTTFSSDSIPLILSHFSNVPYFHEVGPHLNTFHLRCCYHQFNKFTLNSKTSPRIRLQLTKHHFHFSIAVLYSPQLKPPSCKGSSTSLLRFHNPPSICHRRHLHRVAGKLKKQSPSS